MPFLTSSIRPIPVVVLAVALFTAACTPEEQAEPPPSPTTTPEATTASPTPSPTPTLQPVKGQIERRVLSVSSDSDLGLGGDVKPKRNSLRPAYTQIANWLDRHLDNLQRTGNGRLGQVAPTGLAPQRTRAPVTTELASPDRPVDSARYTLTAYHDGDVEMVTAAVVVRHPKGPPSRAHFVFTIGRSGKPVLALFGPGVEPRGGGS